MAPTNATYQDIEGSESLLKSSMEERILELERNTIKKPSMVAKVLCALAVAATAGIAYSAGHSVGHGAATNFAAYEQDEADPDGAYGQRVAAGRIRPILRSRTFHGGRTARAAD